MIHQGNRKDILITTRISKDLQEALKILPDRERSRIIRKALWEAIEDQQSKGGP